MASGYWLWKIAAGGLSLAAFGQTTLPTPPIPGDPLEMVTGETPAIPARDSRASVLSLIERARDSYALRKAGRAYDLKVSFTVDSGGQTAFDGAWQMEDVFDPKQGFRWTAQAADTYSIIRINANGMLYGQDTGSYIPLRLQEVRAALFDPLPSAARFAHGSIRTATANLNGAQVTCVLFSALKPAAKGLPGRRWNESEDCIDPQSGLLLTHSQVPGRYYAYDYSDSLSLDGHTLPRKVTVTEAGRTVTEISVDSLTELPAADPILFGAAEEMKAGGRAITMAGAEKIWHDFGRGRAPAGAATHIVCVFGVLTPSGQLAEAHSLQPSDPNSQTAVETAKQMNFSRRAVGAQPEQHFVFVIERFVSSP